jgi:ABC-type transport system involved in multi-copper enzyme maturation permease subunit
MIWLTWRQFRGSIAMLGALLGVVGVLLALTGPDMASRYSTGIAACVKNDSCNDFFDKFFDTYSLPFLASTLVVLVLPGLVGLFWGAPLITRELEAGTYLLVWNQSITRTRWLAVKLAVMGLVAVAAACLSSLAVTWWSAPMDKSAGSGFALMSPLVSDARGVVPMAYAAFTFVLGVTVGMIVRRTLPAMALTLALFVALQIAMPLLVRPYLIAPVHAAIELGPANVDGVHHGGKDGELILEIGEQVPVDSGAWVLASALVDPAGHTIAEGRPIPVSTSSGPCAPVPPSARSGDPMALCFAELNRLGYRQAATYHPTSGFWPLQWVEAGLYALLTLGLTGLCFRWIRRRVS